MTDRAFIKGIKQKIPVFIVSLNSAKERRVSIGSHLASLEVEYEFVDAVRGSALSAEYKTEVNPDRNMLQSALGCYLSHMSVYDRIIENGIPVALILEDDTILHYSVKAILDNDLSFLDFDYCFLGCDDCGDDGYVYYDSGGAINLTRIHKVYPLSSGPYCLNAYLITLEGAKKRRACAFPVKAPIDHYNFLPYRPKFIATVPMLAFVSEHSAFDSMSSQGWNAFQAITRKYWWYYPVRDFLKLNYFRKRFALKHARLPYVGLWRSFQSGLRIVRSCRYANK